MKMVLLWIAAAALLVWYLYKEQWRPVWAWVVLGLVALPVIGMGFGGWGGMMGPAGFGPGMMNGRGMMGRGGRFGFGGPGMMHNWAGRAAGSAALGRWWWVPLAVQAVVTIALVIVAVIVIRRLLKNRPAPADPVSLLKDRLARGEITPEEYDDLRQRLERP